MKNRKWVWWEKVKITTENHLRATEGHKISWDHPDIENITTRGMMPIEHIKGKSEVEFWVFMFLKDGTKKVFREDKDFEKCNNFLNKNV